MKESIQKLIDTVESIENDANNGVNKNNIVISIESTIPMIEFAKTKLSNAEYEDVLTKLGYRLAKVLFIIK